MPALTPLHIQAQNVAGKNPALTFSKQAFSTLLFGNLLSSIQQLLKVSVPIDGEPKVSAYLAADPFKGVLPTFQLHPSAKNSVTLDIQGQLLFQLTLHLSSDKTAELSHIELLVSNIKTKVRALAPNLVIDSLDYDVQGTILSPAPATRSSAIQSSGLTNDIVLAIEGALALVMPRRVVGSLLGEGKTLDLVKMYPGFDLVGPWQLRMVPDGILVVPTTITLRDDRCGCPPCGPDSALDIPQGTFTETANDGKYSWTPANTFTPATPHKASWTDGFAGIYAPKPLFEQAFSSFLPGATIPLPDMNVLGVFHTSGHISIAFNFVSVTVDLGRDGLVLELDFSVFGDASVQVYLPCNVRETVASIIFSADPSILRIYLGFEVQGTKTLVLASQLDGLSLGVVHADLDAFGKFTGGVGKVVDALLNSFAAGEISNLMRQAIVDNVTRRNVPLLEFGNLAPYLRALRFDRATFSGDADSILVGLQAEEFTRRE